MFQKMRACSQTHQVLCPTVCAWLQQNACHGGFCAPKLSARPAFSLPSHTPTPVGKEVFSLPWKRTDTDFCSFNS